MHRKILHGISNYLRLIDEETKTSKVKVICPNLHSWTKLCKAAGKVLQSHIRIENFTTPLSQLCDHGQRNLTRLL